MMKKNIILDMDGTLIDSERIMLDCVRDYAKMKGLATREEFIVNFVGVDPAGIIELTKREYGEDFDTKGFLVGFIDYFNTHLCEYPVPVLDGARELLDYLAASGWNMALATTTARNIAEVSLGKNDLRKYFEIIVTGDTVENNKPSPEIYLKTCALMGIKPETCFAIEDSLVGIQSAVSAGLRVIAVPDIHEVPAELAVKCEAVLDGRFEVIEFLKGAEIQ